MNTNDLINAGMAICEEMDAATATSAVLALREMAIDGEEVLISAKHVLALYESITSQDAKVNAQPVAWANSDELDNMLGDRTATIQGKKSGWCATPLYLAAPSPQGDAEDAILCKMSDAEAVKIIDSDAVNSAFFWFKEKMSATTCIQLVQAIGLAIDAARKAAP